MATIDLSAWRYRRRKNARREAGVALAQMERRYA
jgi:hypothetical protein